MDIPVCDVLVSISLCEDGNVDCCIAESDWLHQKNKYKNWLLEKRESKRFYNIKTICVKIPLPVSFESIEG